MVPIFSSIFKDQQVLGVFPGSEIFIFPDSDENIPSADSGMFLLSRINCSEINTDFFWIFPNDSCNERSMEESCFLFIQIEHP